MIAFPYVPLSVMEMMCAELAWRSYPFNPFDGKLFAFHLLTRWHLMQRAVLRN